MGQHSIRFPDHIDKLIVKLAMERQTSYTEIVIWACEKYFGVEGEFVARQDRRTISGRVPVAEGSRVGAVSPAQQREVGKTRKAPSIRDTWAR